MTVSVPLFNRTHDASASPICSGLPYEWIKSSFAHVIAAGTTIASMVPRERPGLAMWLFHDLSELGWNGEFRPSRGRARKPSHALGTTGLERGDGPWYDEGASSRCC
jgi:hypothetical protein